MPGTFIVKLSWPTETPLKELDVRRAIFRYIEANDEEAERYGAELAGYRVEVEHAR